MIHETEFTVAYLQVGLHRSVDHYCFQSYDRVVSFDVQKQTQRTINDKTYRPLDVQEVPAVTNSAQVHGVGVGHRVFGVAHPASGEAGVTLPDLVVGNHAERVVHPGRQTHIGSVVNRVHLYKTPKP